MSGTSTARLWLALVDHVSVPGTIPVLFHSAIEPTDERVLGRFPDFKPADLEVSGMFDLSHALSNDAESLTALREFCTASEPRRLSGYGSMPTTR